MDSFPVQGTVAPVLSPSLHFALGNTYQHFSQFNDRKNGWQINHNSGKGESVPTSDVQKSETLTFETLTSDVYCSVKYLKVIEKGQVTTDTCFYSPSISESSLLMKLGSWPQYTCGQSLIVSQTLKYSSDCHLSQQMSANTSHLSSWNQRVTEKIRRLSPELLKGQKKHKFVSAKHTTSSILRQLAQIKEKNPNTKWHQWWQMEVLNHTGFTAFIPTLKPVRLSLILMTPRAVCTGFMKRRRAGRRALNSVAKMSLLIFIYLLQIVVYRLVSVLLCHVNIHQQISESSVLS